MTTAVLERRDLSVRNAERHALTKRRGKVTAADIASSAPDESFSVEQYMHALSDEPYLDEGALLHAEILQIPFAPHQPFDKQTGFLLDFSRDALYGGAAGGGKSDALLMAALQFVDVPGYAAILFRRTYKDLAEPGALMDRSREWFGPLKSEGVRWHETEHKWTFPSGATISFGHMEKQNDHLQYQGAEFQFIAFDELTQFKEKQFRYLFSRLRKTIDPMSPLKGVPLRMRGGTNPGGPGHQWVYMRYLKAWEEWMRRCAVWASLSDDVKDRMVATREMMPPPEDHPAPHFFPSTLDDNPYLDNEDYDESLSNLDQVTHAQLRKGDWQIRPDGRMFKRTWFEIIAEAPSDCQWVRWWDLAATEEDPDIDPDWTAGCLMGRTPQGVLIIKHMVRLRAADYEVERTIVQTARLDGYNTPIGMEQEPGSSGKTVVGHYRRVVLPGYQFHSKTSSGNKIDRAKPLAGRAGKGDVKIVAGSWVNDFLDEAEIFPDGEHDDQVDAAAAAYLFLSGKLDGFDIPEGTTLDLGLDQLQSESNWRSPFQAANW